MRQGLYTIPSGTGFLKRLAEGLLVMCEGDEFTLTKMRVLLPTRRAGRELREAFLGLSSGKPILLPRLQPIGDVDAEEIEIYLSGFGGVGHDIPPAISPLERQFLLSSLVQKKDPELGIDAALSLANDLAHLIDTVYTEDLDFSGLSAIVPDTLAIHWQKTLEFLEIVTAYWPVILAERGQIDPSDRRNRLLKSLAALWREHPPDTPIIAAGSTGSIPSAGELLNVISGLPQGLVILPGLDLGLDTESWDAIEDSHPQATMRNLLWRMKKNRSDVKVWPGAESKISPRVDLLRAVMRPTTTFFADKDSIFERALNGLDIVEAETPREEAAVIAMALREVLETPHKTACFITPDRTLARRVMTALHRWGVEVDDSAGGALATTRGATFLVAILRVVEENFSPLALLDFLKHDYQRKISPDDIAKFELNILRGPRPAGGIDGLKRRLSRHPTPDQDLGQVIDVVATGFSPLIDYQKGENRLDIFCQSIIMIAENFSGGKEFFWSRPESNALSQFTSDVIGYAELIPPLELSTFGGVFRELLTSENYRSDDEPHRRILILGQLESRLIKRDVMILGGLNEGVWPRDPGHDPWMSRPMRRNFGLPTAERGTGLAAHDFVEHASAEKILITRSIKADGTATVPARWLQKLKTILESGQYSTNWSDQSRLIQWARYIDTPYMTTPMAASIPEPCPPQDARPQTLSATWIEKWMKNPYRVYAEKILKLKLLDKVDQDTTHAERGSFVHDVLLDFVKAYPYEIPENAREILLGIGQKKLNELENISTQWHYWWPRFERLIDWFIAEEGKWRKDATPWIQEETGHLQIYQNDKTGRNFTVTAKADRIDRLKLGGAVVLDYKTGSPPTAYKIGKGAAPQLPIESLILAKGGYKETQQDPQKMIYWKLSGSYAAAGEVKPVNLDMTDILAASEKGLARLVEKFEDPHTPYMARALTGRLYDDDKAYAHLSRMNEWASGEGEDESEGDVS